MIAPFRRFPLLPLAAAVVAAASACSAASGQDPGTTLPASPVAPAPSSAATTLVVPAGEGGGALSVPHTLILPAGWTARVWARVPDARMEAWTPEGDLLVSQPDKGRVVELSPGSDGGGSPRTVLSGLTSPQGLAFAEVAGRWVLYVGES